MSSFWNSKKDNGDLDDDKKLSTNPSNLTSTSDESDESDDQCHDFKRPRNNGDGIFNDDDHEMNRSKIQDKGGSSAEKSILENLNGIRETCGRIINNETVQKVIIYLIAMNSITMGLGTFDFVTENERFTNIFEVIDKVFLIIFTIELIMQFFYQGLLIFKNGWLTFDFFIIVLSWASESFAVVRAFRIVRATRIIVR